MNQNPNVVSFVLANSDHGALIVSRLDYRSDGGHAGVGMHLLTHRQYDMDEVNSIKAILAERGNQFGKGVVMIDAGANIGIHTVECANWMRGWGSVIAIEPQRRLFYALCGNIALSNLWNVEAIWAAVDCESGLVDIPELDYTTPAQYGGFELPASEGQREPIGQDIDYDNPTLKVWTMTIDEMELARVDFIKMDIEGMELLAIRGAVQTLRRCRPVLLVEHFKVGIERLTSTLNAIGYNCTKKNCNVLAVP